MSELLLSEVSSTISLLRKTQALVLKIACELLMVISGKKKEAQQAANTLQYRTEHCDFSDLPKALQDVKILFLTDPHIGGNIDTLASEISKNIHILLETSHPNKTMIVHGGDFVCSETGGMTTSDDHFLGQCMYSCSGNNIMVGTSQYFMEGTIDVITLLSASAGSSDMGDWILQGTKIIQTIPANQAPSENYTLDLYLSIVAS